MDRQHALGKGPDVCGAKTRRGTPCKKHPMDGKRRCAFHGGKSTGPRTPKGKARAAAAPLKHGAYSKLFGQLLSKEDQELHALIMADLEQDEFGTADRLMKETVAMMVLQAGRVAQAGRDPSRILTEVRGYLKDLKISRVGREGEDVNLRLDIEEKLRRWLKPRESPKP